MYALPVAGITADINISEVYKKSNLQNEIST